MIHGISVSFMFGSNFDQDFSFKRDMKNDGIFDNAQMFMVQFYSKTKWSRSIVAVTSILTNRTNSFRFGTERKHNVNMVLAKLAHNVISAFIQRYLEVMDA